MTLAAIRKYYQEKLHNKVHKFYSKTPLSEKQKLLQLSFRRTFSKKTFSKEYLRAAAFLVVKYSPYLYWLRCRTCSWSSWRNDDHLNLTFFKLFIFLIIHWKFLFGWCKLTEHVIVSSRKSSIIGIIIVIIEYLFW